MAGVRREQFLGKIVRARTVRSVSLVESRHPPEQCLPEHLHIQPYFSILVRGSYRESCGASTWDCTPGHVIFHASGEVHSDQFFDEGGELLNLEVLPEFEERLREDGIRTNLRLALDHPFGLELALRLRQELRSPDSLSGLAIEGLAMELAARVLRGRSARPEPQGHWIHRIDATLRERFSNPPSLTELAEMVNVHPVHVARTFRKRLHCSVGGYVRMLRLEAACEQLRQTDLTLAEIAAETGFADQSHLSRTLKRYMGISPMNLRRAAASDSRGPLRSVKVKRVQVLEPVQTSLAAGQ
jgi:AraC family transcriptional regulator